MKIFDCFTFFNELDLLEFRLKLLYNVVDKFVICESNYTHSGKEKPYLFQENRERYKDWEDKIIYLPIEQSIDDLKFNKVDNYTPTDGSWILENQQRLGITYAQDSIDDKDIVLVGDLDEIPNPVAIDYLREEDIFSKQKNKAVSLTLLFHYYYMNCQMQGFDRDWNGTVACEGEFFKNNGPQYLRDNRNLLPRIPNAGWHFSYLGGPEKIKNKIESFAHTEFNRPEITSKENIENALEKGQDLFKRAGINYITVPVEKYPEPIKSLMIQYPQFIKNEVEVLS